MNSLKWINTFAFLAMIGVNIAANIIPIGGSTTGDVSKAYPNLFTPAPVTFAIWGIIYILLALFIIFQWGFIGTRISSEAVRRAIGFSFTLSCALNIAWIFAWHMKKIELSTLLIILLLINLIVITRRIGKLPSSLLTSLMVNLGFDLYFGWLIAATIANICVMLVKLQWNRFGMSEVFWTIIILIVGACIAAAVVFIGNRYFAGIAVIWAYVGIIIKHLMKSSGGVSGGAGAGGYAGQYPLIVCVAALGIVLISVATIYRLFVPNPRCRVSSIS